MIDSILVGNHTTNQNFTLGNNLTKLNILGLSQDFDSTLQLIKVTKPILIFLDVDSFKESLSLKLLALFAEYHIKCIVISCQKQFAFKAIKWGAIDYLIKPIQIDDFKASIQKLQWSFSENAKATQPISKVAITCMEGTYYFGYNEIIRCTAESNYTRIVCINSTLVVAKTLKKIEELLPPKLFLRIHKSHLVNINHVKKLHYLKGGKITTSDNAEVPVSRNKKDSVSKVLNAG